MLNHLIKFILSLGILINLIACEAPKPQTCKPADAKEIKTAVMEYVKTNSVAKTSWTLKIFSNSCAGDYALVKVYPTEKVTDPAFVYLHKTDHQWQAMTMGTYFDEEYLRQFPSEIRNFRDFQ